MADETEEERSSDPRFPLREQEPTRGPVDYQVPATGAPDLPDNLGDPTRRRHPTILSAEGEEEAPLTELRPAPRTESPGATARGQDAGEGG